MNPLTNSPDYSLTPLRLSTVNDGNGDTANYNYLANSPLVGQIAFANSGTTRMTTTKQYDYLNRLTAIQSSAGTSPTASFNYAYNSANQRTQATCVDNSYWVYQYDNLGQVISGKKYLSNGTPVAGQQFTYNFDDIGNRKSTASGGDATGSNLRSANYTANGLNQYTSRDVPGYATVLGSANPNATVTVNLQRAVRQGTYFWDELGVDNSSSALWLALTNLAVLNNGTNADIVTTNVGNVFLPQTPETFAYDNDGNLTNSGRWTITWDAENRALSFASLATAPLASQRKVDCAYDYQGRRNQKIVSTNNGSAWIPVFTNRYVYDGWNLIAILNPQYSILQSFMWGTDLSGSLQGAGGVGGLICMTEYAGTNAGAYFYSFDGNGNVASMVNAANGATAAQYEYGPFGEVVRITGQLAELNPFRSSTKYHDDEIGLCYYGYRYYDPGTGRWLSRDPVEEYGGVDIYGFVDNDAINILDLIGLKNTFLTWFKDGYITVCKGSSEGSSDNMLIKDKDVTTALIAETFGVSLGELKAFPENKKIPDGVKLPGGTRVWIVLRTSDKDEMLLARLAFSEGTVNNADDKYAIPSVVYNRIADKKAYGDASSYALTINDVINQPGQFNAVGGRKWKLSETPSNMPRILDIIDWNLSFHGAQRAITDGPMSSLKGATRFQQSSALPSVGAGWQAAEVEHYGVHYYFTVTPKKK